MDRREWDKIAGAAAIIAGVVVTAVGASLVWYEEWVHATQSARGRR